MVLNYYKKVTDFMNIPGKFCEKPSVAGKTGSKQQQKRYPGNASGAAFTEKLCLIKQKVIPGKQRILTVLFKIFHHFFLE